MQAGYFAVRFRCETLPANWPRSFAIVSAFATTGEVWPAVHSRTADERLRAELTFLGAWHHRIVGYHPRTGHAEPSWAVDLPLEVARLLGCQFLQDATFWVVGTELNVVQCLADGGPVAVGSFSQRLDPVSGDASQAK